MRTIKPVGITLSGGLDSSAIACIAARYLKKKNKQLSSFSSVLPRYHQGIEQDERSYIQVVLDQESNIEGHFITAGNNGPFDHLEKVFHQLEMPPHPHHYMRTALWKAARDKSIGLMFSGEGGDFMASYDGRDSLARLATTFKWGKLIKLAGQIHRQEKTSLPSIFSNQVFKRLPQLRCLHSLIKEKTSPDFFHQISRNSPIDDDFFRRFLADGGRLKTSSQCATPYYRNRMAKKIHSDRLVMEDYNISQSYFGMLSSFPFFDARIVDFFMAVPPEQFITGGWKRSLFRRAMEGILPPKIQWRQDKQPFSPDIHRRLLARKDEMFQFLDSIDGNDPVLRYVDTGKIKEHYLLLRPTARKKEWNSRSVHIVARGIILIKFLKWCEYI